MYESHERSGFFTESVKYLLIWNVILFAVQHFVLARGLGFLDWQVVAAMRDRGFVHSVAYGLDTVDRALGLVPALVWQKGFLWQLVTYMFLHGDFFHILFNMFALWMFGSELERLWGWRRFVQYYFFTGVGAGLLTVALQPYSGIPTIGASGAVYGMLLAYAYYFPHRRIFLYFLIPVPVRLFVVIIGVVAFYSSWGQSGGGVAHIAHLGGLVFGWIYLKGGSLLGGMRRRRWRRDGMRWDSRSGDDERWFRS